MSYSNLRKQLDRFETEFNLANRNNPRRKAILMTDSKGKYLQDVVNRDENIIEILFKKGAKSNNKSLLRRAKDSVRGCDSPLLMVWTGTCDFTNFSPADRHISINEISVANVLADLIDVKKEILEVNQSTEIIFLHCPHFSIKLWNDKQGHTDSGSNEDDHLLAEKIDQLNEELISLNAADTGPKFSLDILKSSRVRRGRDRSTMRTKYSYNFKDLYKDGIHPINLLAEVWLRKLQQLVLKKCY
ncbi:unnamed protein product [Mytilus coruscus]|uniref:Uncharacterized protein n=1 Tax=Mytilus coruscus TaxID=42192 RepID=A0A6J7ZZB4_MYTCO|nr:unnamed protein product [Mytilus coruscus]